MRDFPKEFLSSLDDLLGPQSHDLLNSLSVEPPVSVRLNPYKVDKKPTGAGVPWCRYGLYLDQRPNFTFDPLFHAGTYYVQEASSMFVEHLLRSVDADKTEGIKVLDLCAAPGGKTTLISSLVGLEGLVVANEVIRQRAMVLADNVRKWGLGNVVVTNNDPSHFGSLEHWFDVVVVDAPCSGEGMFRKDPTAAAEWSSGNVELCAARQRRILADVWSALRPGGVLIYSTCTFNRRENEDNVEWLQQEFDCEHVAVDVPDDWGVVCGRVGEIETFRLYPHMVRGEGFFAAILRKGDGRARVRLPKPRRTIFTELPKADIRVVEQWFEQPDFMRFASIGDNIYGCYGGQMHNVRAIAQSLSAIYCGVMAGGLFKGKMRPDHSLALFHDLARSNIPNADLTHEQAIAYLQKSEMDPELFEQGINLVCCHGVPLGWVKRIDRRVNNNYPVELRIRDASPRGGR